MNEALARIRALLLDPPATLRRRQAYPLYLLRVAIQLAKQWARDRCPQIAGSLTFQTVLSLVPLLAVASALLQSTGQFSAESALVRFLSERVFPAIGIDLFEHLMSFVENVRKGALGPFGIAITLVISFTLYRSVENVFALIWRVQHVRTLRRTFLIFCLLALMVPLLFGLSLFHTARYWVGPRGPLVSFGLSFLALLLMNKLLPRTFVTWRAALAGATVSAILFEGAKYGFGTYLSAVALSRYKGVYGSVAAIPILLVWVYVTWLVVLFGAVCAHAAQNLRTLERLDRRTRGDGPLKLNGAVALRLVTAIARRTTPPSESELADQFDLDEDTVAQITRRLVGSGVLVETGGERSTLLLGRPPELLTLEDVMEPFRPSDVRAGEPLPRLDALLSELETARKGKLGALTVADVLGEGPAT